MNHTLEFKHNSEDFIRLQINISGAGDLTSSTISGIGLFTKEGNDKILIASYREKPEQFWYDPDETTIPLHVHEDKISCIVQDWSHFKSRVFWAEITYDNKNVVHTDGVHL